MQFENQTENDTPEPEFEGLNEIQKFLKEFPLSSGPPKLNLFISPEAPQGKRLHAAGLPRGEERILETDDEHLSVVEGKLKWDKDQSDEKVSSKEENDEYEDGNILNQSRNDDRHSLIKSNRASEGAKMSQSALSDREKISSRKPNKEALPPPKRITQSSTSYKESFPGSEEKGKSRSRASGEGMRQSLSHIRGPMVESMLPQRPVLLSPDNKLVNESNFKTITELSFVQSLKKENPGGVRAELTPSEIKYDFKKPKDRSEAVGTETKPGGERSQLKDKTHMLNIQQAERSSAKENSESKKHRFGGSNFKCQEFSCNGNGNEKLGRISGPDFLIKIDKVQSDIRLNDGEIPEKNDLNFLSPDRNFFGKSSLMRGDGGLLVESLDQYFFENKDYSKILIDILKLKREVPITLKNLEASQRVNTNKLKEYVDTNHARDDEGHEYTLYEACFNNYTGAHYLCSSSNKKNEIKKFGIGVSLYFKFLKYLSFWFLLFLALSLPVLMVYIYADAEPKRGYRDQLFSTTLGSFGIDSKSCSAKRIPRDPAQAHPVVLRCRAGIIDERTIKFGITRESSPCLDSATSFIEKPCFDKAAVAEKLRECSGLEECELKFFDFLFLDDESCQKILGDSAYFQVTSLCKDSYIDFGEKGNFEKRSAVHMASALDCIISICFFVMIISLKSSEKKARKNLSKELVSVSDFSIMLGNLPANSTREELCFELLKFLNSMILKYDLNDLNEFQPIKIIDIKLSESSELLERLEKRRRLKIKKDALIRRFFVFIGDKACLPEACFLRDMLEKFKEIKQGKQKASKILHEIVIIAGEIEKLEEQIERLKTNSLKSEFKFAWVTFETTRQKKIVYEFLKNSNCNHFLRCSCMGRDPTIRFKGKKLKCSSPPDPLNILWPNINTPLIGRTLRYCLNLAVVGFLIFISMLLINALEEKGRTFLNAYGFPNCSGKEFGTISEAQVAEEFEKHTRDGYIKCFCSVEENRGKLFQLRDGASSRICEAYQTDFKQFNNGPIHIAVLALILNTIAVALIKKMNKLERSDKTTIELISTVLKLALVQGFTLAGICVAISSKYNGSSNFLNFFQKAFGGPFSEMNSNWYREVGVVIMTSVLINTVSVPFLVVFRTTLKAIKRRTTKGCRFSLEKQTDITNLKHIFIGPEFEIYYSYSNVLVTVGISVTFGAAMPLLYLFAVLHFGVLYWTDKILFFKLYRLPKYLNWEIQNFFRRLLYVFLLFRLVFSIWNFGNDEFQGQISPEASYLSTYLSGISSDAELLKEFQSRASKPQTQFQLFLLTLLLLFIAAKGVAYIFVERIVFVAKKYLGDPVGWLKSRQGKRKRERIVSFFEVISKEKLNSKRELIKTLMNSVSGEYRGVLIDELALIEKEIDKETPTHAEGPRLLGLASYDIRDNPDYNINYVVESRRSVSPSKGPRVSQMVNESI